MGKEKMMKEAKKELKEEGLSEEDADKALDMFKKGDKDGLMKMKKEHDAKKGKKPKKEKKEEKELAEKKKGKKLAEKKKGKKLAEKKKGKKLEKKMEGGKPEKPKRLVTLSEESDEASMEKAMKEFEGASDDDKEKMMKEAKKELKEEGPSEEDADKALDMFK